MIYLDNSATTYPKPYSVSGEVNRGIKISSNPGRSSHSMSLRAAQEIFSVRTRAGRFFGTKSEENVIFCSGCTEALNTAIKGCVASGSHVVVSDLEHNSVMRPLEKLKSIGVTCTRAKTEPLDDDKTVDKAAYEAMAQQITSTASELPTYKSRSQIISDIDKY